MLILFKLFFLISMVRICTLYEPLGEHPLFMGVLYALGDLVLDGFGMFDDWLTFGARTVGGFLLAWLYFWLLNKLQDTGPFWWLIVLLGVPLILL